MRRSPLPQILIEAILALPNTLEHDFRCSTHRHPASSAPLNLMLPSLIHEQLLHPFNFYDGGNVYQGMSHQGRLYKLLHTFNVSDRPRSYALGCELSYQGFQVVISVSLRQYKVWVNVAADLTPEATVLQRSA